MQITEGESLEKECGQLQERKQAGVHLAPGQGTPCQISESAYRCRAELQELQLPEQ